MAFSASRTPRHSLTCQQLKAGWLQRNASIRLRPSHSRCSAAIGIDLGTSTSAIAIIKDGKPAILVDEEGTALIPSVVSYTAVSIKQHSLGLSLGFWQHLILKGLLSRQLVFRHTRLPHSEGALQLWFSWVYSEQLPGLGLEPSCIAGASSISK